MGLRLSRARCVRLLLGAAKPAGAATALAELRQGKAGERDDGAASTPSSKCHPAAGRRCLRRWSRLPGATARSGSWVGTVLRPLAAGNMTREAGSKKGRNKGSNRDSNKDRNKGNSRPSPPKGPPTRGPNPTRRSRQSQRRNDRGSHGDGSGHHESRRENHHESHRN